jgi:hypothetical protein
MLSKSRNRCSRDSRILIESILQRWVGRDQHQKANRKPLLEQQVWKIRINQKLTELYKNPHLVANIRRGWEWFERVIRMDQTGMAKNIFERKPER